MPWRARVALCVCSVVPLAACGSDQRTFSGDEFVAEANEHGAGLVLGAPLESAREGTEIYTVELEEAVVEPAELDEHAHGGGSLTITEDADAGSAELDRCDAAVTLVCFRAANVVLFFESGLPPDDQARIADALRALASE